MSSTLKVNGIQAVSGTANAISLTASDKTCTANITNNLSNRNLIINGAMNVAQRATSATTTTGIFVTDRFKSAIVGADEASTTAQVALTSSDTGPWAKGFRNALQITNGNQTSGAGDGDTQQITYTVEAQDIAQSGWDYTSASSYITLSFWVKSSVAQNFYGYLRSEDGTKQLYALETGSLSANTWTKVTKTVPGNSNIQIDNNNGSGLLFCLYAFEGADKTDAGQGLNSWGAYSSSSRTPVNTSTWWTTNDSTFAITGVQLEVSDYATEFEHRKFQDELLRCQRYYLVWADATDAGEDEPIGSAWYNSGSYSFLTDCRFPVEMRIHPSVVSKNATNAFRAYGGGAGGEYFSQINFTEQITNRIARVGGTVSLDTSGKGVGIRAHTSGSGYLHFDAEL